MNKHLAKLYADAESTMFLNEFEYDGEFLQPEELIDVANDGFGNQWMRMELTHGDTGETSTIVAEPKQVSPELKVLLHHITVSAIGELSDKNVDLSRCIGIMNEADSTRLIIGSVQFDAAWQEQVGDTDDYRAVFKFKLPPAVLIASRDINPELYLCELSWNFALPNVNYLNKIPTDAIDYLAMGYISEISTPDNEQEAYECLSSVLNDD